MKNTSIKYDLPAAEYHAIDALSASALKEIRKSPAHYWAWKHNQSRKESDAMRFGTAVHCSVLEPGRFASEYIVCPRFDVRTTAGKEAKKEWEANNKGKTLIESEDMEAVKQCTRSILSHPIVGPLLFKGKSEVSLFGQDDDTGVDMKARLDYLTDDLILDVKTTDDASPKGFERTVALYGYDIQAAHYLEMSQRKRFLFIAIEKVAPYAVGVYELDDELLEFARIERRARINLYASCKEMDSWPAYPQVINKISLPSWRKKNETVTQ